jgi:hypothetical protein
MRTQSLRDSLSKISSINRQLTHAFFIGEQFLSDNSSIIAKNPIAFTSIVFSANTHKDKFNYRLNEINDVYLEYKAFLFTSSFIFVYSTFEQYQVSLFDLVGNIKNNHCQELKNISVLESLFVCLNSKIGNHFDQYEIYTLDYIRWRRNCLIHAEGTPRPSLLALISKNGKQLNSFWHGILNLNSLDFSSRTVEQFSESEFIEILRIIRYLMAKIDAEVLRLVGQNVIISFALSEFKTLFADKIKNRTQERTETMFSNYIQRKFGIERKDLNFSTIVF